MRRRRLAALLLLLLLTGALSGCNGGVAAKTDIVDVESGAGVAGSGKFDATGPWDLTLSYDCSRQLAEKVPGAANGVTLTVYNADDQSEAFEHPESVWKDARGNRALHFQRPGPYWIAVDSRCDWHLLVAGSGDNS